MQRQRNVVGQERQPWCISRCASTWTANRPAHQRHAAFTPACFALPMQWHGATQTHFPPRPRKSAWRCNITNVISPHGLPTQYKQSYHAIPPIIPLTSDAPRLHQHVSRSRCQSSRPAHQRHAAFTPACFALPSGTAPRKRTSHQGRANLIRMALRHHGRNFATRSAHTLQAIILNHTMPPIIRLTSDTLFTPACFALPSGTAPRICTFHQGRQGRANPHGTATSRTKFRHTVCLPTHYKQSYHTIPPIIPLARDTAFTPACFALPSGTAPPRPRKSAWHCDIANVIRHTVCPHTRSNQITLEANTSESSSATLFPALHLLQTGHF